VEEDLEHTAGAGKDGNLLWVELATEEGPAHKARELFAEPHRAGHGVITEHGGRHLRRSIKAIGHHLRHQSIFGLAQGDVSVGIGDRVEEVAQTFGVPLQVLGFRTAGQHVLSSAR
jgi:hypothetical protein